MLQFFLFSLMVYVCSVIFCACVSAVTELSLSIDCGCNFDFKSVMDDTFKGAILLLLPLLLANMIRITIFVFISFWG